MPARLIVLLLAGLCASCAPAPASGIAPRGHADTFDVATWNIQQFGDPFSAPVDRIQASNVVALVSQAEIDLWAVQEITSVEAWEELMARLAPHGYAGVLAPEPTFGDFKEGFIYDAETVAVLDAERPLPVTGSFGGKQPYSVLADVSAGGVTRRLRVVVFHAKNGRSPDDVRNRAAGARKLKAYADRQAARGLPVILLGDFNGPLLRSRRRDTPRSPYAAFVEDGGYVAATTALEEAGVTTYCLDVACDVGTAIDHIVYTANLGAELVEVSRYDEALTAIPNYPATTSDHTPVFVRLRLD